jgi:hypothetical protein
MHILQQIMLIISKRKKVVRLYLNVKLIRELLRVNIVYTVILNL